MELYRTDGTLIAYRDVYTTRELVAILVREGVSMAGAELEGADLSCANLCGANLEDADLTESRLESTNLEGARLKGANLSGADLTRANLKGADLTGANLVGATVEEAILPGFPDRQPSSIQEAARFTREWLETPLGAGNRWMRCEWIYTAADGAYVGECKACLHGAAVYVGGQFGPALSKRLSELCYTVAWNDTIGRTWDDVREALLQVEQE